MGLSHMIYSRLKHAGDTSAGAINLAADIVEMCSAESSCWPVRTDGRTQIPDTLHAIALTLRRWAESSPERASLPGIVKEALDRFIDVADEVFFESDTRPDRLVQMFDRYRALRQALAENAVIALRETIEAHGGLDKILGREQEPDSCQPN